jgi:hypothetical protein
MDPHAPDKITPPTDPPPRRETSTPLQYSTIPPEKAPAYRVGLADLLIVAGGVLAVLVLAETMKNHKSLDESWTDWLAPAGLIVGGVLIRLQRTRIRTAPPEAPSNDRPGH